MGKEYDNLTRLMREMKSAKKTRSANVISITTKRDISDDDFDNIPKQQQTPPRVSLQEEPKIEKSKHSRKRKDEEKEEAIFFAEIEPAIDEVDGSDLLDDIVASMRRFIVADDATFISAALWIVHTYFMDVFTVSPIANISAPEKRSGKSTLLMVLGKLCYRPVVVSNIAPAAIFRVIAHWQPTLLIDEVDTFLKTNESARGILDGGFTKDTAFVLRCVGDDQTPTKFVSWAPKALCGIGKIADTLADRSIPLRLRRKRPKEKTENLRRSSPELWKNLIARVVRWVEGHREAIAAMPPATVDGLNDRANDCWEPLLAIADVVGGSWTAKARCAAIDLHGLESDAPGIGTQLLQSIRAAFGNADRMFTAELLDAIVADEESLWPTWNHGKPMSPRQLSDRLSEFGVRPNTIRERAKTGKGYYRKQFEDAFTRYL